MRERNLPEKLLLVHRFTADMIDNERSLRPYPGVELVVNVDGFGTQAQKKAKYSGVHARPREGARTASSCSTARTRG